MVFYYEANISVAAILIFLFGLNLSIGSLLLFFGWGSRKKLKETKSERIMKIWDTTAAVLFVGCVFIVDVNYWFLKGNYDATLLESLWIMSDIYYWFGYSFILYLFIMGWDTLFKKIKEWREKENWEEEETKKIGR